MEKPSLKDVNDDSFFRYLFLRLFFRLCDFQKKAFLVPVCDHVGGGEQTWKDKFNNNSKPVVLGRNNLSKIL